jgi:hypothetical protein
MIYYLLAEIWHSASPFKNQIIRKCFVKSIKKYNPSTEGAEFVWVSECQKGEGCEIINQFVFV